MDESRLTPDYDFGLLFDGRFIHCCLPHVRTWLVVQVGGDEFVLIDVSSGSFSEYLEYETAYEYAYIQIKSGTESYVLQPIDFVGETPLEIGFYTYVLDVSEDGDVSLVFMRD